MERDSRLNVITAAAVLGSKLALGLKRVVHAGTRWTPRVLKPASGAVMKVASACKLTAVADEE
jgi:hypothetical protein